MKESPIIAEQNVYFEKDEIPKMDIGGFLDSKMGFALRLADSVVLESNGCYLLKRRWEFGVFDKDIYPVK